MIILMETVCMVIAQKARPKQNVRIFLKTTLPYNHNYYYSFTVLKSAKEFYTIFI